MSRKPRFFTSPNTTTTSQYRRFETRRTDRQGGMWAEEIGRGTLIAGWGRVDHMTVGHTGFRTVVTVYREITTRKNGRTRTVMGDPLQFPYGTRVPGTKPRTGIAAGPVHLRPGQPQGRTVGTQRNGATGESRAERHASLIDNLTYLYAA